MQANASGSTNHAQNTPLPEAAVEQAFHSLLQDALIQARAEGLLSDDEIHYVDSDLQVIAPSLSLYFAALQARGDPPSISLPKHDRLKLTQDNVPASFASFFALWQACVPKVQKLDFEKRHDLALILCEREPVSSPVRTHVVALARDIKIVAMQIVQRSTFRQRFQADVQTAIETSKRTMAQGSHYIAPPSSPPPIDHQQNRSSRVSPSPVLPPRRSDDSYKPLPPPPIPTIAVDAPVEDDSTLVMIRETLFAALGDCLATNKDLLSLLRMNDKSWSARCYFASLCLAILDVCLLRACLPTLPDLHRITAGISKRDSFPWHLAYVRTVHMRKGTDRVNLTNCPLELSKLLHAVFRIAMFVQALQEADTRKAIEDAGNDVKTREEDLYIHRLSKRLLGHAFSRSSEVEGDRAEGHVLEAYMMINRLALGESGDIPIQSFQILT